MHRIISAITITRNAAMGVIMSDGTTIIQPPCTKKGGGITPPPHIPRRSPYTRSRYLYRRPLAVWDSRQTAVSGSAHVDGSPSMEIIWMAERITPFEDET